MKAYSTLLSLFRYTILLLISIFILSGCGGGSGGDETASNNLSAATADSCGAFRILDGEVCTSSTSSLVRVISSGLCTGAAITDRHILTAGHCFLGDFPDPLVMSVSGEIGVVRGIFVPSAWFEDNNPSADMAILEVDPSFLSDNQISPLSLRSLNSFNVDLENTIFYVAGFGINPNSDEDFVSLPSVTRMNFHDQEANGLITLIDNSPDTGNACVGDSGAPLVISVGPNESYVIGVTSSGVFSADCNSDPFTRFTDISNTFVAPLLEEIGISPF